MLLYKVQNLLLTFEALEFGPQLNFLHYGPLIFFYLWFSILAVHLNYTESVFKLQILDTTPEILS